MYANTVRLSSWISPRRECSEHLLSSLVMAVRFQQYVKLDVRIHYLFHSLLLNVYVGHSSIETIIFQLRVVGAAVREFFGKIFILRNAKPVETDGRFVGISFRITRKTKK